MPQYRRARSSAWRHVICQADCPENQEDQKTTYPDLDGDGEEVVWLGPHSKCDDSMDSLYGDRETLPLQILRSCRQMYIEANQILWSSNSFSFNESIASKCFMGTRTVIQKRALKRLRLEMEWHLGGHKEWDSALSIAVIRSLHGLQHLRLNIGCSMRSKDYDNIKKRFTGLYGTIFVGGLEKIATLPLTSVEIFVKNTAHIFEDGGENLWSEAERTEYAESIRSLLLNPKGAEVYAQKKMEMKEIRRKQWESVAESWASSNAYFLRSRSASCRTSEWVTKVDRHDEVA